jgi:hypothetical protein
VQGIERRGHENEPSTFFSRECRRICASQQTDVMCQFQTHTVQQAERCGAHDL